MTSSPAFFSSFTFYYDFKTSFQSPRKCASSEGTQKPPLSHLHCGKGIIVVQDGEDRLGGGGSTAHQVPNSSNSTTLPLVFPENTPDEVLKGRVHEVLHRVGTCQALQDLGKVNAASQEPAGGFQLKADT